MSYSVRFHELAEIELNEASDVTGLERLSLTPLDVLTKTRYDHGMNGRSIDETLEHSGAALVLTDGWLSDGKGKTAHGLIRGSERYRVVGIVDHAHAGRDAGEILDGVARSIPIFESIAEALNRLPEKPEFCVVGFANKGGRVTDSLRVLLQEALSSGMSIVCGMHEFIADDPVMAQIAAEGGVRIVDVRRPRPQHHFWTGAIYGVKAPRVAVMGMDCAIGKRTTARFVMEACRERGVKAEMISTGQTGWMQGAPHGFVLDATPNDFVSGELEHAIVACDRELAPDVILIEGQSSLRNPSGPCGAEFLLSAQAKGVILQHAPGRKYFLGFQDVGCEIPPVEEEVELIRMYGADVIGIGLHSGSATDEEMAAEQNRLEGRLGIPVVRPLTEGVGRLVDAVAAFIEREKTARVNPE